MRAHLAHAVDCLGYLLEARAEVGDVVGSALLGSAYAQERCGIHRQPDAVAPHNLDKLPTFSEMS